MDGNRRWAQQKGLPTLKGHWAGYQVMKKIGQWCLDRGIKYLTVWAFSTENWKRSKKEVDYLMSLLRRALREEVEVFHKKGVRLNVLGRIEGLPKELQKEVYWAIEKTKKNTKAIFNLAINYGGRAEIVDVVKKIMNKGLKATKINESLIAKYLYSPSLPEPDLVIRTSGELRTSGFLLWESAYSELYFSKKYWPDFSEKDLDEAIEDYQKRERRFGGG